MKCRFGLVLLWITAFCMVSAPAHAAFAPGNIIPNITLPYFTNRAVEFHLYDYPDRVILLEFFFATCPACNAAAPYIKRDIKEYYAARGGNPDGLPVEIISINVRNLYDGDLANPSNVPYATTASFASQWGLDVVADDLDAGDPDYWIPRTWADFGGSGTPHFAIINGTTNSSSHQQWELVGVPASGFSATTTTNVLRQYINSVKASNRPPILRNVARAGNGEVSFQVESQRNRTNVVEMTSDFVSWTVVTNVPNTNGTISVRIMPPPGTESGFYRAFVQ